VDACRSTAVSPQDQLTATIRCRTIQLISRVLGKRWSWVPGQTAGRTSLERVCPCGRVYMDERGGTWEALEAFFFSGLPLTWRFGTRVQRCFTRGGQGGHEWRGSIRVWLWTAARLARSERSGVSQSAHLTPPHRHCSLELVDHPRCWQITDIDSPGQLCPIRTGSAGDRRPRPLQLGSRACDQMFVCRSRRPRYSITYIHVELF
jgi:hypothetical protein